METETQLETSALLQLLAMGNEELAKGQFQNADEFFIEMSDLLDA